MSDRLKVTSGMILLTASILLIIMSLPAETANSKRYRNSEIRISVIEKIVTEKNGDIRINEADADSLQLLPGIGPAYAERIIDERKKNGPFYYPEDLETVSGIGHQTLTGIRTMIDMTLNEGRNENGLPRALP